MYYQRLGLLLAMKMLGPNGRIDGGIGWDLKLESVKENVPRKATDRKIKTRPQSGPLASVDDQKNVLFETPNPQPKPSTPTSNQRPKPPTSPAKQRPNLKRKHGSALNSKTPHSKTNHLKPISRTPTPDITPTSTAETTTSMAMAPIIDALLELEMGAAGANQKGVEDVEMVGVVEEAEMQDVGAEAEDRMVE